jgi:hypothetical protein
MCWDLAVVGFGESNIIVDNGWVASITSTSGSAYLVWIKTMPNARSLAVRLAPGKRIHIQDVAHSCACANSSIVVTSLCLCFHRCSLDYLWYDHIWPAPD